MFTHERAKQLMLPGTGPTLQVLLRVIHAVHNIVGLLVSVY